MSASISSPVQESSFEQASEESPDMNTPTADMPATSQDGEGYEWLQTPDGANWYRLQDSGSEWTKY